MSSEWLCFSDLWVVVISEPLFFTRISLSPILLKRGSGLIKKRGPFGVKVTLSLSESKLRGQRYQFILLLSTDMSFDFFQPLVWFILINDGCVIIELSTQIFLQYQIFIFEWRELYDVPENIHRMLKLLVAIFY